MDCGAFMGLGKKGCGAFMGYTANVYIQSAEKLIFFSADSTQQFCTSIQKQSLSISTCFCLWSTTNFFSVIIADKHLFK